MGKDERIAWLCGHADDTELEELAEEAGAGIRQHRADRTGCGYDPHCGVTSG